MDIELKQEEEEVKIKKQLINDLLSVRRAEWQEHILRHRNQDSQKWARSRLFILLTNKSGIVDQSIPIPRVDMMTCHTFPMMESSGIARAIIISLRSKKEIGGLAYLTYYLTCSPEVLQTAIKMESEHRNICMYSGNTRFNLFIENQGWNNKNFIYLRVGDYGIKIYKYLSYGTYEGIKEKIL